MSKGSELAQIKTARGSLQKFRVKLLSPSVASMESGSADLVVAMECLTRLEPMLAGGRRSARLEQALRLEAAGLRRELEQVNALLHGAGNFYQGWSRLLGCGADEEAANYMANGKPGALISNDSKNAVIHG